MSHENLNAALDGLLGVLSTPLGAAINPAVPAGALALSKLLRVIQAGVAAHEAATGEPLDMDKLHQIELLPVPDEAADTADPYPMGAGALE